MKKIVLHPAQQEIYDDESKYRICAIGRRFGAGTLEIKTINDFGIEHLHSDILFVLSHFSSAMYHFEKLLDYIGNEEIEWVDKGEFRIGLKNACRINITYDKKIMDFAEEKFDLIVIDDYACFNNELFAESNHMKDAMIFKLMKDENSKCLVMSTPSPQKDNKFMFLYLYAKEFDDCSVFRYTSSDNTMISQETIEDLKKCLSEEYYNCEILAEF